MFADLERSFEPHTTDRDAEFLGKVYPNSPGVWIGIGIICKGTWLARREGWVV
jgi:hypothetical protein